MSLTVRGPGMSVAGLHASQALFERSAARLSSGLRIGSAADDAAGLAISERLRSQVTGSAMAARNVSDGISMLQTAEGGLGAITSILQRLRDLSVQAANTGALSADGRAAAAQEVSALVAEIDRTSLVTAFNGRRLLDGSHPGGFTFQVGADSDDTLSSATTDVRASTLQLTGVAATPPMQVATVVAGFETHHAALSNDFTTFTTGNNGNNNRKVTITLGGTNLADIPLAAATTYDADSLAALIRAGLAQPPQVSVEVETGAAGTKRLRVTATAAGGGPTTDVRVTIGGNAAGKPTFSDDDELVPTQTSSTSWTAGSPGVASLAELVAEGDQDAIRVCDAALATVLDRRAETGALQNRLEHRLSILATTGENLAAARSRIADADMAQEWAGLVRAQLLTQSGSAIQSQAVSGGQRVVQLLGSL